MVQLRPNGVDAPGRASVGKRTLRNDKWWANPLTTWILLTVWVVYATVRAFSNKYFFAAQVSDGSVDPNLPHYLTPFASPCVTATCPPEAQEFGQWFGSWYPTFLPAALIALIFVLGFRTTCYYYRKAYYRAFARTPSACAVPEPHKRYNGETRFPLIFQNLHRYFFYAAVIVGCFLTWDVIASLRYGFGFGTLIMAANAVLLWCYTLGCHACRHAIGGQLRHFSKHPVRYRMWKWVSALTNRHMQFAWTTLGTLMITDAYVLLLSWGAARGYSLDLFYISF
jgi:hypothetical protein